VKDEIRRIITDQINRHVAAHDTHRAWLADDIATRVENELSRLLQIEKEEYETRGAIQHHINRCELPWETALPDDQSVAVGKIVDELHKTQGCLAAVCKRMETASITENPRFIFAHSAEFQSAKACIKGEEMNLP
jgi:hypothetical protein